MNNRDEAFGLGWHIIVKTNPDDADQKVDIAEWVFDAEGWPIAFRDTEGMTFNLGAILSWQKVDAPNPDSTKTHSTSIYPSPAGPWVWSCSCGATGGSWFFRHNAVTEAETHKTIRRN